ncbi:hypothetical protein TNCV_3008771 [Trichonephila clavipes]|nr:hypothetical protein TNCV_3008771 [Trichonephila clavipes]
MCYTYVERMARYYEEEGNARNSALCFGVTCLFMANPKDFRHMKESMKFGTESEGAVYKFIFFLIRNQREFKGHMRVQPRRFRETDWKVKSGTCDREARNER